MARQEGSDGKENESVRVPSRLLAEITLCLVALVWGLNIPVVKYGVGGQSVGL